MCIYGGFAGEHPYEYNFHALPRKAIQVAEVERRMKEKVEESLGLRTHISEKEFKPCTIILLWS